MVLSDSSRLVTVELYILAQSLIPLVRIVESVDMTYEVILRKKQNKYIARVREWPEVVIEEETREAALAQIKQQLMAYLSQAPEVVPIELEVRTSAEHPWLRFAGMWADDPTWDDFVAEVTAYRQEMDAADVEA